MPCQGATGCGGCQRSAPTGGAAYGMPRYSAVSPAALPRTEPSAVRTTGVRPDPWPDEAVEAVAAQPASVAAARQAKAAIRIPVVKPSRSSSARAITPEPRPRAAPRARCSRLGTPKTYFAAPQIINTSEQNLY